MMGNGNEQNTFKLIVQCAFFERYQSQFRGSAPWARATKIIKKPQSQM